MSSLIPRNQAEMSSDVFVAVMSPTCGPFGPLSHLNKAAQPAAWQASYERAAPHGRFCGVVALLQLRKKRHFVNEQPVRTYTRNNLGRRSWLTRPW